MSHYNNLVELIGRIERLQGRLGEKSGNIYSYSAEVNGVRQSYRILNIKNPAEYKDEILSLLVWVWGYKDHIIKYLIEKGVAKNIADQSVLAHIRGSDSIKICMDLANAIKHSGLDTNGWTALKPELKEVGFSVPLTSLSKLEFSTGIVVDIEKPSDVNFHAKVHDKDGNYLGDAIEIMDTAMKDWEEYLKHI